MPNSYRGVHVTQVNAFRVDLQQQLRIDLTAQREQLTAFLSLVENRNDADRCFSDSNSASSRSCSAGVSNDHSDEDNNSKNTTAGDEMEEWVGLEKIRAGEFGANMLNDLKVRLPCILFDNN